jgi:hypothetical protein
LHMATGNQFTEMLCTARNNKPRPSAVTFWLLPLTRGVAFHPTTGWTEIFTAQSETPSHQFWCCQTTSTPWRWGQI